MRGLTWLWCVALAAGCGVVGGGHKAERQVCEAYLDCASDVTPEVMGELVDQYGEQSSCWDTADQAELCSSACQEGAVALLGDSDEARDRCEEAAAGGDEPEVLECPIGIEEDRYADRFFEIMCDESQGCGPGNMADLWCDPTTTTGTTELEACTYDPAKACECLAGTYTCNEDVPGFEFVEPPVVCAEVYDCSG